MNPNRVFVLASANMDLVIAVDRLPREGETRRGGDLALFGGGKGANQGCAAGRPGRGAVLMARVGEDAFGAKLIAGLEAAGVDVGRVWRSERPSGAACIYVLPDGENSIVISPGAHAALDPAGAVADLPELAQGDLLLAQLETPLKTVEAAFRHARGRGAITILASAPAQPLGRDLLGLVNYITPNQTEAALLLGEPDRTIACYEDAGRAADRIAALGPRAASLKLGAQGCLYFGRPKAPGGAGMRRHRGGFHRRRERVQRRLRCRAGGRHRAGAGLVLRECRRGLGHYQGRGAVGRAVAHRSRCHVAPRRRRTGLRL